MSLLAVDVGGTKLAVAVFSDEGELLSREAVALGGREGAEVEALIADRTRELLAESPAAAVGVAVPGIYYLDTGEVWAPNIPGWDRYPLAAALRKLLPETPILIDSDRACYVLGEAWQGAARGCRNAVFLAVGTGIGAGVLVEGRVLRGERGIAGAIGWLALDRPFRDVYTGLGCFEYQASGPGLVRVARELLAQSQEPSTLREGPMDDLTTAAVFAANDAGDALARQVLDNAVELWGMAVANVVSLFDPEVVVLGGGVFGPAAALVERIREEALRWAQPIAMPKVPLQVSTLGPDAGLYGAAFLAREALATTTAEAS